MKTLTESKEEFLEECREVGREYASEYIQEEDDYGKLSLVAAGHGLQELSEYLRDQIRDRSYVAEFGGAPDEVAVLEGLNEALQERRDEIIERMKNA